MAEWIFQNQLIGHKFCSITFLLIHLCSFGIILPCRRNLEQAGEEESLKLEGDVGGGLVIDRKISLPTDNPKVFRIDSGLIARSVGEGSGGYSRFVFNNYAYKWNTRTSDN